MENNDISGDRQLVEACIRKDISAWSKLVNKYSRLVHISIEKRLKRYNLPASRHDIEDIKQNLLSDIWLNNKLEAIRNRDDISYWISIASGNAAIEHFRSAGARQNLKVSPLDTEDIICDGGGIVDELTRAEIEARVDEAIEALPHQERLIMKLHLIDDKKYHEISEILGIPKGTVSSYIKRAKEKLRATIKNI